MSEKIDNTLTGYLGPEFQKKLVWQLLVDSEYSERTLEKLSVDYFDDPIYKRLYLIMMEYFKEYEKTPNLQNQSILQAIKLYKSPNNLIEEESLFSVINQITLYNERVINKNIQYDGDAVQKTTDVFIKQQEYRKLGEKILQLTRTGEIKDKNTISLIEEWINKIDEIGQTDDYGVEVGENIKRVLSPEFRETIPTGIKTLDSVTGGGLGKGEIGLILSPSGVGKTTILTKIANTAYEWDYNVLQIIYEDKIDEVERKHYTLWSKIPLSEINDNSELVEASVNEKLKDKKGKLVIKKYTDETIPDIKAWILRYQKKFGITFQLITLDYLDCVGSHKKTADVTEAEFIIVKSLLNLSAELNIPIWSATQGNRSSFGSNILDAEHQGGSIKRIQKAHFVMSIAKPKDMKETHLANIKIIKARFAQDGQIFNDCIFNNDTMEIKITNDNSLKLNFSAKETEKELEKLDKKMATLSPEKPEETIPEFDFSNNILKPNKDFYGDTVVLDPEKPEETAPEVTFSEQIKPSRDFYEEDVGDVEEIKDVNFDDLEDTDD